MSKKNIYLPRLKMCKPKETFKVPCTEVIIAEDEHRVAIDGVNAGEAQAYMYDTKTGRAIVIKTVKACANDLCTEICRATQQMLEKLECDCLASLLFIDGVNAFHQIDLQAQELANQPIQLSRPALKVKSYKTTEEMMDSYIKKCRKDRIKEWMKKNVKK